MLSLAEALPWFLPGLAVSALVALIISPFVAHVLGTPRAVAFLMVVSIGAIAAATLLPAAGGLDMTAEHVGGCHTDRPWVAPLDHYLRPSEESLNVLLFVPLGIAVALLPRARRTLAVGIMLFGLSVAVESFQVLVPVLGRSCEIGDVVANTLGLGIGLLIGVCVRTIGGRVRSISSRSNAG